jgi:hypothetical protein
VKDGQCRVGRGSLGEVLPAAVRARFVAAAAGSVNDRSVPAIERARPAPAWVDDFAPLS